MEFLKENRSNPHLAEALKSFLPDALTKNTELEIRFGRIMDKSTQKRLAISMMHPCAIGGRSPTLWFESTISEGDFKEMQKYFKETFPEVETKLIRDTLLKGVRRSETKEIDGKPARQEPLLIKKVKKAFLDIFCPENKYDIRVGICEEIHQKDNLEMGTYFSVREKRRTTYKDESFCVDATEVKAGKPDQQTSLTYEVEIEAKNSLYTKDQFITIVNNTISILQKTLK